MLISAYVSWAGTAKACERADAARAFAQAYVDCQLSPDERQAVLAVMVCQLDDPSPKVRQALADVMASARQAPRSILFALAEDQPDIAARILLLSPALTDDDLVELAGCGDSYRRALIAARPGLTVPVSAALSEIGDMTEILVLLENQHAQIAPFSLTRMAERLGEEQSVRGALLARQDLPAQARHLLVRHVAEAFSASSLLRLSLGEAKSRKVCEELGWQAAAVIAGQVDYSEMPALVDDMRRAGQLTPAFLMRLLCRGQADIFAVALEMLSGLEERRVRSILASGRHHAVKALMQAAGLEHGIAPLFAEAVMLWRDAVRVVPEVAFGEICEGLLARGERLASTPDALALLTLVETMRREDERRGLRLRAHDFLLETAA
ncbi:DUF2336 domain-containing protein [Allorhizobium undicola]|uniref:DUF2336 domain-containing protein n=1 Tax=Allorhizobium undicola TaxID=78527 RepID=UPI00048372B3|nr:DUF2336 domain-containing protein [Allorhizobium undicola]